MDKIQQIKSNKNFLTVGVLAIVAIFLANTSPLNDAFAVDNGGYGLFDCSFDNDKGTETCCDDAGGKVKCLECDVNLTTGEKSNCREVDNTGNPGKNIRPGLDFDGKSSAIPQIGGMLVDPKIPSKGGIEADIPNNDGVLEQPEVPTEGNDIGNPNNGGVVEQPEVPTEGNDIGNPNNGWVAEDQNPQGLASTDNIPSELHKSNVNDPLRGLRSNNDNSPTPPACPDKGPIPPDCTLKPKF
jgi:hypothetical protein